MNSSEIDFSGGIYNHKQMSNDYNLYWRILLVSRRIKASHVRYLELCNINYKSYITVMFSTLCQPPELLRSGRYHYHLVVSTQDACSGLLGCSIQEVLAFITRHGQLWPSINILSHARQNNS